MQWFPDKNIAPGARPRLPCGSLGGVEGCPRGTRGVPEKPPELPPGPPTAPQEPRRSSLQGPQRLPKGSSGSKGHPNDSHVGSWGGEVHKILIVAVFRVVFVCNRFRRYLTCPRCAAQMLYYSIVYYIILKLYYIIFLYNIILYYIIYYAILYYIT